MEAAPAPGIRSITRGRAAGVETDGMRGSAAGATADSPGEAVPAFTVVVGGTTGAGPSGVRLSVAEGSTSSVERDAVPSRSVAEAVAAGVIAAGSRTVTTDAEALCARED